jgi:hypothetical protein
VISAYVGNDTTQITAGITLSVDFDSVTGLNNVRVVATGGNGYATASNYQLVITTGTVGGTSVVGYVVAEFSIENRSALMPTTAARTLDVSAGGEGGVDWANVGSPTTTLDLSGTTVATTQKVDVNTIKTNPVVNGGTATFPTNATLASTANITAAAGCAVSSIGANVITAAATAADFSTEVNAAVLAILGTPAGASMSADIAAIQTAVNTIDDFLDTEIAAILAAVDTEVAAIKAKTDSLTFTVASVVDANIQRINDVTVLGDGAGTTWGP